MYTEPNFTRSPSWWTEQHNSRWDRVKAAFRRDWEQTKDDLSGGRRGEELNQDAGDTLGQAFGDRHIPAEGRPNPMDAEERAEFVQDAQKKADRVAERLARDTEKAVERAEKEERKELKAEEKAARKEMKALERQGIYRWDTWEEAEVPLRYGHGAASFYGPDWNEETERRLRAEWGSLYPTRDWDDVRETVRRGWDYERP